MSAMACYRLPIIHLDSLLLVLQAFMLIDSAFDRVDLQPHERRRPCRMRDAWLFSASANLVLFTTRKRETMPQTVVPMIHVPDVSATVDWYASIGFELLLQNEEDGEVNWAKLSFGN